MASALTSSRAPSCFSCLRRTLNEELSAPTFHNPTRTQWRGKKKLPKATTIPVRMLQDVKRYGSKGTLIAVPPATMRNEFFPNSLAAYIPYGDRKRLAPEVQERDYFYGVKIPAEKKPSSSPDTDSLPSALSFAVSPIRSLELLQKFVPPIVEFFRPVLQTPPVTAAGKADADAVDAPIPTTATFTPVTTADIAGDILARLADGAKAEGESQAARVVLGPQDVKFLGGERVEGSQGAGAVQSGEIDRVNSLGDFFVKVQVRGGGEMRRRIRILPEAAPAEILDSAAQEAPL